MIVIWFEYLIHPFLSTRSPYVFEVGHHGGDNPLFLHKYLPGNLLITYYFKFGNKKKSYAPKSGAYGGLGSSS